MSSGIDLRSVSVDLADAQPISTNIQFQSTDFGKYLRKLAGIDTPYIPCAVICIAFDLIFTLITLVVGSSNTLSCPIEPRIPIYLVVCSAVNLVSIFFTIVASVIHKSGQDEEMIGFFYVTSSAIIIIIFQLFNFIWLIFGTVWVFSIFNQVQQTQMNQANYCQGSIYKYTIASVILQYIIPLVMCCFKNLPLKR